VHDGSRKTIIAAFLADLGVGITSFVEEPARRSVHA
jgi:hypothetical protein